MKGKIPIVMNRSEDLILLKRASLQQLLTLVSIENSAHNVHKFMGSLKPMFCGLSPCSRQRNEFCRKVQRFTHLAVLGGYENKTCVSKNLRAWEQVVNPEVSPDIVALAI